MPSARRQHKQSSAHPPSRVSKPIQQQHRFSETVTEGTGQMELRHDALKNYQKSLEASKGPQPNYHHLTRDYNDRLGEPEAQSIRDDRSCSSSSSRRSHSPRPHSRAADSRTVDSRAAARKKVHPQIRMDRFWKNFDPDYEGGVTQILPEPLALKTSKKSDLPEPKDKPINSYQKAREQCIKSVNRIVRECRALNQKYTDIHFDVERDLKLQNEGDCLYGLLESDLDTRPQDVKRVTEICEKPQFYKDGATFDDIVQSDALGDCWFLAALSALTVGQEFLEKVCVIRDEEIGVYGFVFHRDGEWHPCIIDDKLYLKAPSFEESGDTVLSSYSIRHPDQEKKYKETFQTGSKALFFAACSDENETWVPLIEKAFAKAHGDYSSLNGGHTGEALEDLTGGVSTEVYSHNILSKDKFWTDRLSRIGKDYIFSCGTAPWLDDREVYTDEEEAVRSSRRKGVLSKHAYAVLDTYEGHGQRLVKIRNPWGYREWNGAWSDGSSEWTSEWVDRLKHKFGDDGVFWISYEDMLQRYRKVNCTRLFGPEWHSAQQWAQVQVPWNIRDYQQTKFTIEIPEATDAVIVLSQLDDRYFCGFEGAYFFRLQFRLQIDEEEDEDEYITRSNINYNMQRSTSVEVRLEPGKYAVLFKVEALESGQDDIETVIRKNIGLRKNKVTQIATLYDLAHKKGQPLPKKEKPAKIDRKANKKAKKTSKTESAENGVHEKVKEGEPNGVPPPVPGTVPGPEKEAEKATSHDQTNGKDEDQSKATDEVDKPTESAEKSEAKVEETQVTPETKSVPKEEVTQAGPDTESKPTAADEKATQTDEPKQDEPNVAPPKQSRPGSPAPSYDGSDEDSSDDDNYEEDDEDEDPQRNPWNAFCTVGLRVYSKIADIKINVVRPAEEQPAVLDGEDIAKSALAEAVAEAQPSTNGGEKKEGENEEAKTVTDGQNKDEKKEVEKKEDKQDDTKSEGN